jgi:hypothetical protein
LSARLLLRYCDSVDACVSGCVLAVLSELQRLLLAARVLACASCGVAARLSVHEVLRHDRLCIGECVEIEIDTDYFYYSSKVAASCSGGDATRSRSSR